MSEITELNRRVVYAGLSRMTDDRTIQQKAYAFWLKTFGDQPLNVKDVVLSIEQYLGLKTAEKKALYIAMQAAAGKRLEQLMPVPEVISGESDRAAIAAPKMPPLEKAPSHVVALQFVLTSLAASAHRVDRGLHMELADILAQEGCMDLPSVINKYLKLWGDSQLQTLTLYSGFTVDDCQAIFHAVYLLMAEVLGPVETDRIVDQAIQHALRQAFAETFNPTDLL